MTAETALLYRCWCPCGGTVQVTFVGGFHGTTCQVVPCERQWNAGMRAFTIPRSAALDMEPVTAGPVMHRDGLVTLA